jgi:hypothetical protein
MDIIDIGDMRDNRRRAWPDREPRPYRFSSAGSPPWAEMLLLIAFSDA